jgi:chemotaxis protein methyltransferase CheR
MPPISTQEFQVLAKYIHGISGISLDSSKAYLIENRFVGVLKEFGCSNYSELYYKALSDGTQAVRRKIIDAITTGETLFFRDTAPFELLQFKIMPDLIDQKTAAGGLRPISVRIWSAACSTGQEVYSIAIVLKELLQDLRRYSIRLLGTDISDAALARASYGKFNKFEIERGLPKNKLERYFTAEGDSFKIKDEIRAMAAFQKINLMEKLDSLGRFDIIFCRNVAIYFNEQDKLKVFDKLSKMLEPGGSLIIGATESISGICPQFEPKRYLRSIYYQLKK